MAKNTTIKVKLVSSADTGFYYVTYKNSRTMTDKLVKKKYDPVAKKHVEFRESKIKEFRLYGSCKGRRSAPFIVSANVHERHAKGRQIRWPAGTGVTRRPLAPLPCRPNPTDSGDAADLSKPQGYQWIRIAGGIARLAAAPLLDQRGMPLPEG
jgi:large subunit ribosomal protein L33